MMSIPYRIILRLYRSYLRIRFKKLGKKAYIRPFIDLYNPKYMEIGDQVQILRNVVLQAFKLCEHDPIFKIGNLVRVQYNVQISSIDSVIIEDGCTIGSNAFITDSTHDYTKIDRPAIYAPAIPLQPVVIGAGTWVGRNAIISGCKIGKHCVIGAHAFVNKDIPDFCVVAGSPARIVKRYNFESQQWEKTNPDGSFIEK